MGVLGVSLLEFRVLEFCLLSLRAVKGCQGSLKMVKLLKVVTGVRMMMGRSPECQTATAEESKEG